MEEENKINRVIEAVKCADEHVLGGNKIGNYRCPFCEYIAKCRSNYVHHLRKQHTIPITGAEITKRIGPSQQAIPRVRFITTKPRKLILDRQPNIPERLEKLEKENIELSNRLKIVEEMLGITSDR